MSVEYDKEGNILGFQPPPVDCASLDQPTQTVPDLKKSLHVLSLFDGIGSGMQVLNNLQFDVEDYFSCEIDRSALSVQKFWYHDKITHLGSVTLLTAEKLDSIGHIDLLMGASPCADLSLVNPRRRGLYGELLL